MLTTVDHIDLRVPDLAAFIEFFKSLGFVEVRRSNPDRKRIELALPGENQVVFEIAEHEVGTAIIDHIAFRVEDMERDAAELRSKGVPFLNEPHVNAISGRMICLVNDPTNEKWQLIEGPPDRDGRSWKLDGES